MVNNLQERSTALVQIFFCYVTGEKNMGKGIFITGTDTGVGKTIITAILAALLREEKIDAIPYKPIQSGALKTSAGLIAEDVEIYRSLLGLTENQEKYCSYALEAPLSPHLAAKKAGVSVSYTNIKNHFHTLTSTHELVIAEGAGGLGVPLIEENNRVISTIDFIKELNLPLIIVTHPKLGTINHTLLTVSYAQSQGIPILGLVMNQWPTNPSDMERDNMRMIEKLCSIPFIGTVPCLPEPPVEYIQQNWQEIRQSLSVKNLLPLINL